MWLHHAVGSCGSGELSVLLTQEISRFSLFRDVVCSLGSGTLGLSVSWFKDAVGSLDAGTQLVLLVQGLCGFSWFRDSVGSLGSRMLSILLI